MTLREMRERQEQILAEARQRLDEISDDTDEARARELEEQYDRGMAEYDRLEERCRREEEHEEREQRLREQIDRPDPRRPVPDDRTVPPTRENEVDVAQAFTNAMRFGVQALELEERQALANLRANVTPEMRAQSVGTGSEGGFTVPEGFMAEIVRSMLAFGPMLDPGVTRVIETASGNPLPWPTLDDTANKGVLLAENTAATEQDVVFAQKQLDAYMYTSKIVRVSLQLLQDSAFDMNSLLRDVFGERIGRIGNEHLTTGTGSAQPNGIVTASTLGVTAAANNAITLDEMIDLEHSIDPAYRSMPGVRWMFHDSTLKALRKIKDSEGNYIWQPADVRGNAPASLMGYPYTINQDMAQIATVTKSVVFGNFQKYVVRRVREFTMMRLVERYADFLQVGFIGFARFDGELIDTAAVKHLVHPV